MNKVALTSAAMLVLVGCSPSQDNVKVPEGTAMTLELETSVRSDMNLEGDPIVARTVEPLVIDGRTIVAGGAKVYGEVESIDGGNTNEPARITLTFNEIENAAGEREDVDVKPFLLVGLESSSDSWNGDAHGAMGSDERMGSDDPMAGYDKSQSGQALEGADPTADAYDDHRGSSHPMMGSTTVLRALHGTEEVQVPADAFHGIELAPGQQLLVVLQASELPVLAAAIR